MQKAKCSGKKKLSLAFLRNTGCLVLSCLMKLAHLPTMRNTDCGNPVRISRHRGCQCCHRLDTWLGILTEMWLKSEFSEGMKGLLEYHWSSPSFHCTFFATI